MTTGARGQAFTLEGFVAALLLVASLAFVMQATGVTALSSSTASGHVVNQQAAMADGLLDAARADGSLRTAVLYWSDADATFHGTTPPPAGSGYFTVCGMPDGAGAPLTEFGDKLSRTFHDRGVACNVNLRYVDPETDDVERRRLIYMGAPTDDAVRAATSITLYDDDRLSLPDGSPGDTTLTAATAFYAPDADPDGPVYNVVRVEVIVWRT